MVYLFIEYYIKTIAKLLNKIKKRKNFNFNHKRPSISKEESESIFQCILYMFLLEILAEEKYSSKSKNKIISYCLRNVKYNERYKEVFILQVVDYLTEFTEKEILIKKKTKSGNHRYSFNKSYYERIKK